MKAVYHYMALISSTGSWDVPELEWYAIQYSLTCRDILNYYSFCVEFSAAWYNCHRIIFLSIWNKIRLQRVCNVHIYDHLYLDVRSVSASQRILDCISFQFRYISTACGWYFLFYFGNVCMVIKHRYATQFDTYCVLVKWGPQQDIA
jgi:hypothetical protein